MNIIILILKANQVHEENNNFLIGCKKLQNWLIGPLKYTVVGSKCIYFSREKWWWGQFFYWLSIYCRVWRYPRVLMSLSLATLCQLMSCVQVQIWSIHAITIKTNCTKKYFYVDGSYVHQHLSIKKLIQWQKFTVSFKFYIDNQFFNISSKCLNLFFYKYSESDHNFL